MSYEEDLQINEHALEREFLKQPGLYMRYAEKAADAEYARKKSKENLEVVRAEINKSLREDASDKGVKITEKALESMIPLQKEFQEANSAFLKADHIFNMINAAVRAFDHKKHALENLVKLMLAGYYSAPRDEPTTVIQPNGVEKEKTVVDASADKQKKAINRKKRTPRQV